MDFLICLLIGLSVVCSPFVLGFVGAAFIEAVCHGSEAFDSFLRWIEKQWSEEKGFY